MKFITLVLALSSFVVIGQNSINTKFIKSTPTQSPKELRIDEFGTHYYFNTDTFYANGTFGELEYSNIQLGNITSANVYNPLKINLFYNNFNSVIILDNRLAEIIKIDFNNITPFRDISHVTAGYDNDLWIFNENSQQLELFNFIEGKTKFTSLPISGKVLDLSSNYNYCWLLTSEYLYTYNYVGLVISKIKNEGFEAIETSSENLFLQKENKLYYKAQKQDEIEEILLPELLISQFFVTNETLYIYDGKNLNHYQLLND